MNSNSQNIDKVLQKIRTLSGNNGTISENINAIAEIVYWYLFTKLKNHLDAVITDKKDIFSKMVFKYHKCSYSGSDYEISILILRDLIERMHANPNWLMGNLSDDYDLNEPLWYINEDKQNEVIEASNCINSLNKELEKFSITDDLAKLIYELFNVHKISIEVIHSIFNSLHAKFKRRRCKAYSMPNMASIYPNSYCKRYALIKFPDNYYKSAIDNISKFERLDRFKKYGGFKHESLLEIVNGAL